MDDRFLHELRREPRGEFARALRERLRLQEPYKRPIGPMMAPALAAVAAVVLAVMVFTLPSVRASAQSVLDFFRVRRFAAVQYDEARMEKLESLQGDKSLLVFDQQQKVRDPGPPQYYPTLDAAGAAAGVVVRKLTFLPSGLAPDSVFVEGAGEARLAVSSTKLRTLLDQLDLRDVSLPDGLDGQWVEVRKAPVVIQKFKAGSLKAGLAQSASPEVSVPAGLDVVQLAEVGLRVLGLDAGEARRVARATDWRSTLLVPVPMNASTFREVTIHGHSGLLITTTGASKPGGRRHFDGSVVMWTEDGRVFGLMTNLGPPDAVQMAESVQ